MDAVAVAGRHVVVASTDIRAATIEETIGKNEIENHADTICAGPN
jgi:hypothetical protein